MNPPTDPTTAPTAPATRLPLVPASRGLRRTWILAFGSLAAAFPLYTWVIFGFDADRERVADVFAVHVTIAYFVGIFAAALPLPSLRSWTPAQRLQAVVLAFVTCSYLTHLSWELAWLVLHERIAEARDSVWAYTWWAYIDGGDLRYFHAENHFLMIEVLSVANGLIGITGLVLLHRRGTGDLRAVLLIMSTAVTHTVLTWYYYGTEILSGFASVNTASALDVGVKFILLNSPWLIAPWLVLAWGYRLLAAPRR